MGHTIFQADVIQFRQQFNEKLETLRLKTDAEKEAEMVLSRLGIKDLIGKVSASYASLIQNKNWESAGRSADTSVVPVSSRRVCTPSSSRMAPFRTAEEPKARVTTAENKATSLEIARNRAENVPKAEDKEEGDTTDVAVVGRAAEDTSAVAAAEPIKAPAGTLLGACPLMKNADRLHEMGPQELSDGAMCLQPIVRTACDMTAKPGSGVTTARCG
jgi:hypothetical protein